MEFYALLDGSGRVFGWRSREDLQAAGWIAWAPGGGWRVTPAGRAHIKRLLAAYTRADADRDLARLRERKQAPRQTRDPWFGGAGAGGPS